MCKSRDSNRAQQTKIAAGRDELFSFGKDFKVILDILEDEDLEEQFTATANDVSRKLTRLTLI